MNSKKGFTLIELLIVIAVLAILGTIIVGASSKVMKTARQRRFVVTSEALSVALTRYYTEYGYWPVDSDNCGCDSHNGTVHIWNKNNDVLFSKLRKKNNDAGIRFIDESTLLVPDGKKTQTLAEVTSDGKPLVYVVGNGRITDGSNKGNHWEYYEARIDYATHTATVYSRGGNGMVGSGFKYGNEGSSNAEDEY